MAGRGPAVLHRSRLDTLLALYGDKPEDVTLALLDALVGERFVPQARTGLAAGTQQRRRRGRSTDENKIYDKNGDGAGGAVN